MFRFNEQLQNAILQYLLNDKRGKIFENMKKRFFCASIVNYCSNHAHKIEWNSQFEKKNKCCKEGDSAWTIKKNCLVNEEKGLI